MNITSFNEKKNSCKSSIGKVKRWFYTIGIPKLGSWEKRLNKKAEHLLGFSLSCRI
jgi:hypothetical protein